MMHFSISTKWHIITIVLNSNKKSTLMTKFVIIHPLVIYNIMHDSFQVLGKRNLINKLIILKSYMQDVNQETNKSKWPTSMHIISANKFIN